MSIVERPSLTLLGEPDVVANPYPVLAALRAASPYTAIDDALVVLGRHAENRRAQTVFGLSPGDQGVWRYDGSGMSWTQVGGPASAIVAY